MSKGNFIRCDHWRLQGNPGLVVCTKDTIDEYRLLTNALCSVVLTHWPSLASSTTQIQDLERLIHPTKDNPNTVYGQWFQARFARFPSYLRRAAEQAALGAVSSFMTRYQAWQGGNRARRDAQPPTWGGFQGYPVLYSAKGGAGAMVKYVGAGFTAVHMKLFSKADKAWHWHAAPVVSKGKRHEVAEALRSPTLMLKGNRVSLTLPMDLSHAKAQALALAHQADVMKAQSFSEVSPGLQKNRKQGPRQSPGRLQNQQQQQQQTPLHLYVVPQREVVCAVDLGVNTQATCSIIDSAGTVISTLFIQPRGIHMARQDRCVSMIQTCARKTMGGVPAKASPSENVSSASSQEKVSATTAGKLSKGFCSHAYRRAANLNTEVSRETARKILAFARKHGALVVVFEDLKGFRPKARASIRRPNLKQRFHTWLHRKLVHQVEASAEEQGLKVAFVNPRGTSAWAYDGSGKVKRDANNMVLCTFQTGKRYNADLNASYNIGARYFWRQRAKTSSDFTTSDSPRLSRKGQASGSGKSSRPLQRMPVTLSSLWVDAR